MAQEAVEDQASLSHSETESEQQPQQGPRRSFSSWRSRSRTSLSRTSTRSRAASPDAQLHQIYSAGFLDHHGTYLHRDDLGQAADGDEHDQDPRDEHMTSPTTTNEKDDEKEDEDGKDEPQEDSESVYSQPRTDDPATIEKAETLSRKPTQRSVRSQRPKDPNMVSWAGPDDPENPKNWPNRKKWAAVVVVSLFTFISPTASSLVAPALPQMAKDLHVHDTVIQQMMLSIFILAYAIGPMFLGPLSEIFGRIHVLQLGNLFFLIFNLVCGFAQNGGEMLAFRFLAGLGGSAPLAIGGGILADCFSPEQRGKAIAVYSVAPLIGPAVGPIAGGFISETIGWKWGFWIISIACVVIQVMGLFFLQETWAPTLLERKTKKLRQETGNPDLYAEVAKNETLIHKLEHSLVRPFKLLFTQPIVIALAIYMAYLYGLVYLVISSFSILYTSPKYYNESVGISGLHYIALAVGYFVGTQLTARFNDWLYRTLKKRNGGKGQPEFRVPVMIPCAILLPIGFFWYGWSAQARVFWIMPDIGVAIVAGATICGYQSIQTYVIDSYQTYAASAIAAISFLRSLAGFGFPLFALNLYGSLGYGWGNSILAFVAIAIGVPAPWFFWNYGAKLREKSRYASG